MDIQFQGMEGLMSQFELMETGIESAKDEALLKGAEIMQKAAKRNAPVVTGNLKNHILISDANNGEIEVYVDQQGKAYYGYFHEVGTSKMRAHPFMFPAFNQNITQMQNAMADSIKKRIGLI